MEIRYFIGGSVASGSCGLPRQTNDIDIVADFSGVDLEAFCQQLQGAFYHDIDTIREAVHQGRSFNIIDLRGALKFDFFPADDKGFAQSELSRRQYKLIGLPGVEGIEFAVSSPEDTILAKLRWYRQGGEISDRQWHDVLGIVTVQTNRLDAQYMEIWAERLGVTDLLRRAIREAEPL